MLNPSLLKYVSLAVTLSGHILLFRQVTLSEVSNCPPHIAAHWQAHKTCDTKPTCQRAAILPAHGNHPVSSGDFRRYLKKPILCLSLTPMKFLFSILSLFMLYMSCLPCGDSKECNIKTEAKISATDNHQQHEHQSEACTPFCTCSCCAASAFYSPLSKIQASKILLLSEKHLLLNEDAKTDIFSSIWQPPKIS